MAFITAPLYYALPMMAALILVGLLGLVIAHRQQSDPQAKYIVLMSRLMILTGLLLSAGSILNKIL